MNEYENPGDILIVDDQPLDLKPLYDALRQQGHNVRAVDSGRQALQAVQSEMPELIVLETRMPDLDGFEVCRRLKAEPLTHDIPVVFVAESGDLSSKSRAFEVGAADYLAKPYELEELLVRIGAHLAVCRSRRTLMEKAKNRIRQLSESNQELTKQVEELKPALEKASPDHSHLERQVADLETALQHAREQLRSKQDELEQAQKALNEHQQEASEAARRTEDQLREQMEKRDAQMRAMAQEIADAKRREEASRSMKTSLEARLTDAEEKVQEAEIRSQAAVEMHQEDQEKLARLQEKLDGLAKAQAQQAQESEQAYRLLFESATDAILVLDQENAQILEVNPAACRLYGYTQEEFRQLRIASLSEEPQATIQSIQRGDLVMPRRVHRKKDGSIIPTEITTGIFRVGGRARMVEFVRDITERIRSEEELKKQCDALDAMVDERAAELEAKDTALSEAVAARRKAEEALQDARLEVAQHLRQIEEQEKQREACQQKLAQITEIIGK